MLKASRRKMKPADQATRDGVEAKEAQKGTKPNYAGSSVLLHKVLH